jgi:hypothetical protein
MAATALKHNLARSGEAKDRWLARKRNPMTKVLETLVEVAGPIWLTIPPLATLQRIYRAKRESYKLQTPDGEVKLTGEHATLAKRYIHDSEGIRGKIRSAADEDGAEFDTQAVQDLYDAFDGPGGTEPAEVDEKEAAAALKEGRLAEYLISRGVRVTS